jgi:hypothetical protein
MIALHCDRCSTGYRFKICLFPLQAVCDNCKNVNQIPEVQLTKVVEVTEPLVNLVIPKKDNGYKVTDLERKEKEVEEYLKMDNQDYVSAKKYREQLDETNNQRYSGLEAHDGAIGSFLTLSE